MHQAETFQRSLSKEAAAITARLQVQGHVLGAACGPLHCHQAGSSDMLLLLCSRLLPGLPQLLPTARVGPCRLTFTSTYALSAALNLR
jgi:hypothetical protein